MIFIKENNYCCENYYKALSSYIGSTWLQDLEEPKGFWNFNLIQ